MGKKFVLLIMTAVTVLILGAISLTFQFVTAARASIYEEVDRTKQFEDRFENLNLKEGEPISILLMGIDSHDGQTGGRSDTMVLVTVNPKNESMQMVSIPRDTYVPIKGGLNKINSSYQVGGAEKSVRSVEKLLNVPVDYFLTLDMDGFEEIVDAYGGVEVNNDLDFTDEKVHFPKGQIQLDGKEALIYARMRKKDPRGDFGRQKRQRQVIEAILNKAEGITSVTQFGDIAKVVKNHVRTNMTFLEMWEVQSNYKGARKNIKAHKIEGKDSTLKGTYYYMPDEQNLKEISHSLRQHLGLEKIETKPNTEKKPGKTKPKEKPLEIPAKKKPDPPAQEQQQDMEEQDKVKEEIPEPSHEKSETPDENQGENNQSPASSEEENADDIQPEPSKPAENNEKSNVLEEITKNWTPIPTRQENHTKVTFEKGSLDWEEMTSAIAQGAGLPESDMILWWVAGNGPDGVIATVTNKAETKNYRVYVSWIGGAGYKPTKAEVLRENDMKQ